MKILRIYMGEHDKYKHYPMYEYILKRCYELKIAGATVIKGIMGFGQNRHIHRSDFFTLSEDLPIIIEIVDTEEKIKVIENEVSQLPFDGIMVVHNAEVITVKKGAEI